jgi:CDP-6-deoxy-D-xylo-4-hexulose-3-dehydrase
MEDMVRKEIDVTDLMKDEKIIKQEIMSLVRDYYKVKYNSTKKFEPGDKINYAGRVFDQNEIENLVGSALDFWLTAGKYTEEFEERLCSFLHVKYCLLCNSGSSANLLAFMALTSPLLKERQIKKGDEIITVAACFPTTVSPIIQYGAVPVFIDVTIPQYNIDCSMLECSLTSKTKAVIVAHTLGNPFNLEKVKEFCDKNGLWLIEDNCDSLGAKFYMDGEWKYTGTIGDIGTSSFYPPHHITMGEGGAVYTNSDLLFKIIRSLRDWGRDCCCPPGKDNVCGHRFKRKYGQLPPGYDHKYVYSHFGYNLKATDMQAAVGVAQLEKLPLFIERRRHNWNKLRHGLNSVTDKLILPEPCENSQPSWFGFCLSVKDDSGFTRDQIINFLESNGIQTRTLFAGNLLRHPCFDHIRQENDLYRAPKPLVNTDRIMENTFWIGVYPKINDDIIEFIIKKIKDFLMMGIKKE